jgi:hypothetical protein
MTRRVDTPALQLPAVIVDVRAGTREWEVAEIGRVAEAFPGAYWLALKVGKRLLTFGPAWKVEPCPELEAALEPFGSVEVMDSTA